MELDVLCPQWEGSEAAIAGVKVFYTHTIQGEVMYGPPKTGALNQIKGQVKSVLKWEARKSLKPGLFAGYCRQKWLEIEDNKYDFLIGSYGPADVFHFMGWLRMRCPELILIADYRDHWSFNRYQDYGWLRNSIRKLERNLVGNFNGVVAVSETIAKTLYDNKVTQAMPEVVYNGYTKNNQIEAIASQSGLIVHTGALYGGKRSCTSYFRWLVSSGYDSLFEHVFITPEEPDRTYLKQEIARTRVRNVIVLSKLSYAETLQWQHKAAFGLLILSDEGFDEEYLPVKMFEYIGSGKPVIFCGNTQKSEAYRLLQQFGVGDHYSVFHFDTPVRYKTGLIDAGRVFDREKQADRLAIIIQKYIDK